MSCNIRIRIPREPTKINLKLACECQNQPLIVPDERGRGERGGALGLLGPILA